jgi:hypothetical protein
MNQQEWTIENFVDVVNEVLLQVTDDSELYDKVQTVLNEFLMDKITLDAFAFEFAMLVRKRKEEEVTIADLNI